MSDRLTDDDLEVFNKLKWPPKIFSKPSKSEKKEKEELTPEKFKELVDLYRHFNRKQRRAIEAKMRKAKKNDK